MANRLTTEGANLRFLEYPVIGASNTSPITITLSVPASSINMIDNDYVQIYGCAGNTGANGIWQITYAGGATFTLDGSAGNGTYTGNGWMIHPRYPAGGWVNGDIYDQGIIERTFVGRPGAASPVLDSAEGGAIQASAIQVQEIPFDVFDAGSPIEWAFNPSLDGAVDRVYTFAIRAKPHAFVGSGPGHVYFTIKNPVTVEYWNGSVWASPFAPLSVAVATAGAYQTVSQGFTVLAGNPATDIRVQLWGGWNDLTLTEDAQLASQKISYDSASLTMLGDPSQTGGSPGVGLLYGYWPKVRVVLPDSGGETTYDLTTLRPFSGAGSLKTRVGYEVIENVRTRPDRKIIPRRFGLRAWCEMEFEVPEIEDEAMLAAIASALSTNGARVYLSLDGGTTEKEAVWDGSYARPPLAGRAAAGVAVGIRFVAAERIGAVPPISQGW